MASLQINDDEVELWVVRGLTAKLIDCKMDQMNQVVVVRYVLPLLSLSAAYCLSLLCGHMDLHSCTYWPHLFLFSIIYPPMLKIHLAVIHDLIYNANI